MDHLEGNEVLGRGLATAYTLTLAGPSGFDNPPLL